MTYGLFTIIILEKYIFKLGILYDLDDSGIDSSVNDKFS